MEPTKEKWKLMNVVQKSHIDHCCDKNVKADFYSISGLYWETEPYRKKTTSIKPKAVFYLWILLVVHTDILSFSHPVHIVWGNAMSGTIYQSVSGSHISLAHRTRLAQHAPGDRNPCHSCWLMQRGLPDRMFLCYQWRSPESRILNWDLRSAWSSSFCSWKWAGCWSIPPAAPASLFPLQLSLVHLPQTLFFFCSVRWSFCPCLWNQSVHFTKEAETLFFYWSLWLLWGKQAWVHFRGCTQSILQRSRNVVQDTAVGSQSEILKEDWRMSTESWHWHGALCQRLEWGQSGCINGRARSVRRWWQSSSHPVLQGRPSVHCSLSITVPQDYPGMLWVRSEAFWWLVSG